MSHTPAVSFLFIRSNPASILIDCFISQGNQRISHYRDLSQLAPGRRRQILRPPDPPRPPASSCTNLSVLSICQLLTRPPIIKHSLHNLAKNITTSLLSSFCFCELRVITHSLPLPVSLLLCFFLSSIQKLPSLRHGTV